MNFDLKRQSESKILVCRPECDKKSNFFGYCFLCRGGFGMGFFRDSRFLIFIIRKKFFGFFRFSDHREFFGISWKSPGFGIFFSLGIIIPGIFYPRDFYPGDSGLFRDFLPSGYPGDKESPGSGYFFVGWDIPTKSHLWK